MKIQHVTYERQIRKKIVTKKRKCNVEHPHLRWRDQHTLQEDEKHHIWLNSPSLSSRRKRRWEGWRIMIFIMMMMMKIAMYICSSLCKV
jgi:hypothetical protein